MTIQQLVRRQHERTGEVDERKIGVGADA
ncbi:MAG: hypothetical protein QOJ59_2432, partial [Thermomicrobiales bacterium]|nr:hypothetical protein [Thermomicrobiales bacterium]